MEKAIAPYEEKLAAIQELYGTLGREVPSSYCSVGDDLSHERMCSLADEVQTLSKEVDNRRKAVKREIETIRGLMTKLEVEPATALDRAVMSDESSLGCTDEVVEALSSRAQELVQLMKEREERIKEICCEISSLWERIGVDDDARESFLGKHRGVSAAVLGSCVAERDRLVLLKKEMTGPLVLRCRDRIDKLLLRLNFGEREKEQHEILGEKEANFTEDLLEAHEKLEADFQALFRQLQPILKDIARREKFIEERVVFEREQLDPSRLVARGPGAAARLKNEEKTRNKIKVGSKTLLSPNELVSNILKPENPCFDEEPSGGNQAMGEG